MVSVRLLVSLETQAYLPEPELGLSSAPLFTPLYLPLPKAFAQQVDPLLRFSDHVCFPLLQPWQNYASLQVNPYGQEAMAKVGYILSCLFAASETCCAQFLPQ